MSTAPLAGGRADPARRLVVNADDLGLSVLVNEGIEETIRAGVVTSVSILVNTPGFDDAVRRAEALGARVSIGLHFNLTTGRPVSPAPSVPSLVDASGRFLTLPRLVARALGGRLRAAEVRREADAQFARLCSAGLAPDHVDSHRHVHAAAAVRGPRVGAAHAAGVRIVRRPLEPLFARPAGPAALLKRAALAAAWSTPSAGPSPVPGTASFRGLALLGGRGFEADLLALLDALPTGSTELMVHPGREDASIATWDPYIAGRAVELAALLSPSTRERLARSGLTLTGFGAA